MKAAFFDVDETLIRLKSMVSFQEFYFSRANAENWPLEEPFSSFQAFMTHFRRLSETAPREDLNRAYYHSFAGRPVERVTECCREWFRARLQDRKAPLWHAPGLNELRRCQQAGYHIVLVSGSFEELLAPLATDLRADNVIATHLIREENVLTGDITGTPCIGEGKATRIQSYAWRHGIDLAESLAVGDHYSDIPMLSTTGHARYIPGDPALEKTAKASGWQALPEGSNGKPSLSVNL